MSWDQDQKSLEYQPRDYFTVYPISKFTIQFMVWDAYERERKGLLIIILGQQAKTRTHLNELEHVVTPFIRSHGTPLMQGVDPNIGIGKHNSGDLKTKQKK